MVAVAETAAEPCGYLVTLRLTSDDLPQRLFTTKRAARRYAETVDLTDVVSAYGANVAGCRPLDDAPLAIVEFENGRVIAVEHVERDDLPEFLAACG